MTFFYCSQLLAELSLHSSAEQKSPFKSPGSTTEKNNTIKTGIPDIFFSIPVMLLGFNTTLSELENTQMAVLLEAYELCTTNLSAYIFCLFH